MADAKPEAAGKDAEVTDTEVFMWASLLKPLRDDLSLGADQRQASHRPVEPLRVADYLNARITTHEERLGDYLPGSDDYGKPVWAWHHSRFPTKPELQATPIQIQTTDHHQQKLSERRCRHRLWNYRIVSARG
ncbi:MAG TPA: hypothetical protein VMU34_17195 [Mycobacterium sp.]|nr:hypothetical protein [Mycobacterium sp.]